MAKSAEFTPRKLAGRWRDGYALDQHTVSSIYLGENQYGRAEYDTTRSEVGELLYRLKYKGDRAAVRPLATTAARFVRSWKPGADVLVSVPPSRDRSTQPVLLLGEAIAKLLRLPFEPTWVRRSKKLPELKDVYDYDRRFDLLRGAHKVAGAKLKGRVVLLFDDLYRSGATMNTIAEALYDRGRVADVFALTITKTRSNR
jgi:predicted amidophosphoribosyltransferase